MDCGLELKRVLVWVLSKDFLNRNTVYKEERFSNRFEFYAKCASFFRFPEFVEKKTHWNIEIPNKKQIVREKIQINISLNKEFQWKQNDMNNKILWNGLHFMQQHSNVIYTHTVMSRR